MILYRHKQMAGWGVLAPLAAAIVLTAYLGFVVLHVYGLILYVFYLAAVMLFFSLTIIVDDFGINIYYGPGMIHKRFRFSQVESCRIVHNKNYPVWGISLTTAGTIFNISRSDAIELTMTNGHKYRVGTNDTVRLNIVINNILKKRNERMDRIQVEDPIRNIGPKVLSSF